MSASPRPAPNDASASAPRFASLSTSTWSPSRCDELARRGIPAQPGRIIEEPTLPVRRSIGPGRPTPAPRSCASSTPAAARSASTISTAASMASAPSGRRRSRAQSSAQDRRGEVGERDADAIVVEVDADGDAGGAGRAGEDGRAAAAGLSLAVRFLDDEPRACRSATRLPTVVPGETGDAGEVAPARESAAASASMTSTQLRSRRTPPDRSPLSPANRVLLFARITSSSKEEPSRTRECSSRGTQNRAGHT